MSRVLESAARRSSPEFAANAAAHEALAAELRSRLERAQEGGGEEARRRLRERGKLRRARAHRPPLRPRHRLPRALAARRRRALRGRAAGRRHRHRRGPRVRPPRRRRRQRRHRQGRQLRPDDREEAPARAGDRARKPAALHLPRRLRRRLPAAAGRGLPRPRPLRADLLQPGAAVARRHRADRRRDGVLHGRRRLRPGDERRDGDRARAGDDLPGGAAAAEGGDRRDRQRRGARRRRRAHAPLGCGRPSRAGRCPRARARARRRRDAARAAAAALGGASPASRRPSTRPSSTASSRRRSARATTCAR